MRNTKPIEKKMDNPRCWWNVAVFFRSTRSLFCILSHIWFYAYNQLRNTNR